MSKIFETHMIHMEGRGDFDMLSEEQLISVSHDCVLYVFDLNEQQRVIQSELDLELNAVAVHPFNKKLYAIGGKDNMVQSYENFELTESRLIQTFSGEVHRIVFSPDGRYLGIASQENVLNIYSYDMDTNIKCRPSHDGMVMNVAFDPNGRYLLSLGCDGWAFIFQLSLDPRLIIKYKISKEFSPDSHQYLQCDWRPTGDILALAGQQYLQVINTENDPKDLIKCLTVCHKLDITIVKWLNQYNLITVGLDKTIKLWNYRENNEFILVWQTQFKGFIQQIRTTLSLGKLLVLDDSGVIHCTNLAQEDLKQNDLKQNQQILDQSKVIQEQPQAQVQTEQPKIQQQQSRESVLNELLQNKIKPKDRMEVEQVEEEVQEKEEQKQIKKITKQDDQISNIIDIRPQNTIQPTKTEAFRVSDRMFLLQNYIGSIKAGKYVVGDQTQKTIEVEFFDKFFHKPFKFDNDGNYELAALNYRGVVLASKGPNNRDSGLDEYVDEENQDEQPSRIYFQSLHSEIEKNKFIIDLPDKEGVEAVCIGNDWLVIVTDVGMVRVLGFSGVELTSWRLMRPLVSICAYENLLVVAYLDSVPMFGCQMIKARIYDIDLQKLTQEIEVCISLYSELVWMGFSEDGLLLVQDSKDFIFAYLFEQASWVQVNYSSERQGHHFWLFGATEYVLLGYWIDTNDKYPDATQSLIADNLEFTIQCLCNLENSKETAQQIQLKEFIRAHEMFRVKAFSYLNDSRMRDNDPLIKYSKSIWDQAKFNIIDKEITVMKLQVFKALDQADENEKLLEYFKLFFNSTQLMNIAKAYLERKNNKPDLLNKLNRLFQDKAKKQLMQKASIIEQESQTKNDEPISFGLKRPAQNLNSVELRKQNIVDVNRDSDLIKKAETLLGQQISNSEASQPIPVRVDQKNPFAKQAEPQTQKDIFSLTNTNGNDKLKEQKKKVPVLGFGQNNLMPKAK